jgi:hypothetical protein
VHTFDVNIEIAPLPIDPLQEGDKWFMQVAMEVGGISPTELLQLYRYCCHQQVLYVSDILGAGGKCLDKWYLTWRREEENWSSLIFPTENPPQQHILLWCQVLYAIAPRGRVQNRVRRFLS